MPLHLQGGPSPPLPGPSTGQALAAHVLTMSTSTSDRFAYLDAPDPFAVAGRKVASTPARRPAPMPSGRPRRDVRRAPARTPVIPTAPLVPVDDLEPLAAYDYAKREQARATGEPTDRTRAPGVIPGVTNEETGLRDELVPRGGAHAARLPDRSPRHALRRVRCRADG